MALPDKFSADPMAQESKSRMGLFIWLIAGLVLLALGYFLVTTFMGAKKPGKPSQKQITMVKLQTPPPPPPKPPEPPPPPPPKEQIKLEQPKPNEAPKPDNEPAQAAPKLGVDADANGPGDGFGLAANKGGRDIADSIIGTGKGTGSTDVVARAQYTFYRDVMVRHVSEALGRVAELRDRDGTIPLLVWLDRSGRIERIEIQSTNMSAEQSALVKSTLLASAPVRQAPPENMPQPLRLKVRVQDAG